MVDGIKGLTPAQQKMSAMAGSMPETAGQEEQGIWGKVGHVADKGAQGLFPLYGVIRNFDSIKKMGSAIAEKSPGYKYATNTEYRTSVNSEVANDLNTLKEAGKVVGKVWMNTTPFGLTMKALNKKGE